MKALVLVDLQNDFTPATEQKGEGALAVPEGNDVLPVVNGLMAQFPLVVATQDWHPAGHKSFASEHPGHEVGEVIEWKGLEQVLWPDHCVQGTEGADFLSALDLTRVDHVVQKGTDRDIDSYSGFFDNGHCKATGLEAYLKEREVEAVYIVGLATDYCVRYTALDAVELGFETYVVRDACRGVDLNPGDVEAALEQMREAGAKLVNSREVPATA